jgi:carbamate kinase
VAQTALIAVGGNSLIRAGEKGTIAEQLANTRRTAEAIVQIIRLGYHVVVTHGNGPQVGAALIRSERAADQVYTQPLDVCVACTQGEIGYLLQQSLRGALAEAGLNTPVVSVLTQVVVSPVDPAMERPTKPVGPFYSGRDAEARREELGWNIVEDAARGWRRVVPSPDPLEIVEEGIIQQMVSQGSLVVALGGGGIPVVRAGRGFRGVEAVIDKDRASALLASRMRTDLFIVSTDADRVYVNFKKPDQRPLDRVTAPEMRAYLEQGQFPPGNMGPKIESALSFLERGGREVIITTYDRLAEAVRGHAGTHITAGNGQPGLPRA